MSDLPPGWSRLPIEPLPGATFWPAALAFAITLLLWGLVSSWVIFGIGLAVLVAALAGWINDLRHERKHPK